MTQLVVSGNRILAHGEDCFLAMGGTVICTVTGRKFEKATVVFHDGAIPSDIDSVGYEYRAGDFVPCAPYGEGTGNIAVVCDDCKTIKDSGISSKNLPNLVDAGVILSYIPEVTFGGAEKIIYENGKIVVLTGYSLKYSTDLKIWETTQLPFIARDIAYGGGKFIVVGYNGIAYSTDLTTWTAAELPDSYAEETLRGVAYGNGRFVVTTLNSVDHTICGYSTDGETWSELSYTGAYDAECIAFGNGTFVVASDEYAYSTDGVNWKRLDDDNLLGKTIASIKFLDGSFMAVSKDGVVLSTTAPAEGWTHVASFNKDYYWYDIDYKDGVFVVLADGAVEVKDKNYGDGWKSIELSETGMRAVANNGEQFVACGNRMLTSKDGKDWPIRGRYRLRTPDLVDVTEFVKEALEL